jgi:hypothetical protein
LNKEILEKYKIFTTNGMVGDRRRDEIERLVLDIEIVK